METLDKALDLIRQLAEAMGQTTAYLWPRVVLYEWAQALGDLLVCGLVLIVALVVFYRAVVEGHRTKWPDEPTLYIKMIPAGVLLVVFFLVVSINSATWFATLVSPEGYTVLHILGK